MTTDYAIGLMSGTSLDGIDASLIKSDGRDMTRMIRTAHLAYDSKTQDLLRLAIRDALQKNSPKDTTAAIEEAAYQLTRLHARTVKILLDEADIRSEQIACIGFHGQTVAHRPDEGWTWQIGQPELLASLTGIDVVFDFRSNDIRNGGQGAPLVPLYHRARATESKLTQPVVVANIGGIANVTWIGPGAKSDRAIVALDTGPGGGLLDEWIQMRCGQPMDLDGTNTLAGRADLGWIAKALSHPWFELPPPKSLDRHDFSFDFIEQSESLNDLLDFTTEDGAATLAAFTAACMERACRFFPQQAERWIICGGGRHNPGIMNYLKARLSAPVLSCDVLGWRGDFLEAEAFAWLGLRSLKGLPLTTPETTGVDHPVSGGVIFHPLK